MREGDRTSGSRPRDKKMAAANRFYRQVNVDIAIARGKSPEDPEAPLFSGRMLHKGRIETDQSKRTRGSK